MPIIFFYQNKEGNNNNSVISSGLKKSLSETLTHYYPLAGRIIDGATIECNDEGACFTEARVKSHVEEFLKHHEDRNQELFMPDEISRKGWDKRSLLIIQITLFSCGGIAIGMRIAHEVADIAAISAFLNDWAATMTHKSGKEISAELTRFFPPSDSVNMPQALPDIGNLVRKRFIFDSIKLDKLKAKATRSGVGNPTGVEVVAALIYRCAVAAESKVTSGFLKPSAFTQVVNLRKRIIPRLPEKSFGNMTWFYAIQTAEESDMEFPALVGQLKAGMADFCDSIGKNLTRQELIQLLFGEDVKAHFNDDQYVNKYICTSWCRSSLYETDFGWGKPIWLGHAGSGSKNLICLNDTREGDGIEAFVTLEQQEMALFEQDEKLLQFCYLH